MPERPLGVLFLCTGNSARSILAESLLNHRGRGRFQAYSAGSFPTGVVHPLALDLLQHKNLPTDGLRSKSWDEFTQPGAPPIDIVITVCDNAAGEACPIWSGRPIKAHWGISDPAAAMGTRAEKEAAFQKAFDAMDARITEFLSLPVESMEQTALRVQLEAIGKLPGSTCR